ncbi:MAG: POTRA domain-containing protein [Bacteroidales bacterium]
MKLASGDVVTENLLIKSNNTIKKYFVDKGYLDTEVKISQIPDTLRINHVRLQIDIDKKEKIKIRNINIVGNEHFDDQKVKKFLKETKERKFPALL